MEIAKEVFESIFPKGLFDWFEIAEGRGDIENVYIALTEKDLPPFTNENKDKRILARKFHDITITDFPLRGKRTLFTFRRRYRKLEGQDEYLKREIGPCFPGTQLEVEGKKSGDIARVSNQIPHEKRNTVTEVTCGLG